ncbi:MAG: glycosyltransferase [Sphingorhabdus sp.]|uniref:glycosyltransferase n=1 Tax=Sphingorhabdus sp. TaxID=1902408 RepID=UPI0025DBB40E|nr:glycosyltransferase [Sphingorhabdus sp.]MCO4090760.1 glycosyltransferase [Sphingorhabdus sp.]
MIQIVLLHHNQPDILLMCINSIVANTRYPYRLFVVDNKSDSSAALEYVKNQIAQLPDAHYIQNKHNNWIYGFNLALEHNNWIDGQYYVFSDADIIFPEPRDGDCWLTQMLTEMNQHRCIGKLGLNLSLDNIKDNKILQETFELEKKLLSGSNIGSNIIAPVDTTAAIYRNDYFLFGFRFRIGHARLFKPHYYTCRTSPELSVIHKGWDFYPGSTNEIKDKFSLRSKALAMSKMGAYVAPEILNKLSVFDRLLYKSLRMSVRMVHSIKVILMLFGYLIISFPNKLNPIQNSDKS